MDGWQIVLLAVAAYITVNTLVRMMVARRNQLWTDLQRRAMLEKRKQQRQQP